MTNCSVCREYGHSRTAHYVHCAVCGHQSFIFSMKEVLEQSNPDPSGRKRRVNLCGNVDEHRKLREWAATLSEGTRPRSMTPEEHRDPITNPKVKRAPKGQACLEHLL